MATSLHDLPNELLERVLGYIGSHIDFHNLKITCKRFLSLGSSYRFIHNATIMTHRVAHTVFKERENVFLTGAGGCGKSYTLRHIVERAESEGRKVAVTATTGRAAVNLEGGVTIHSFAGIGKGTQKLEKIIDTYIEHNKVPGSAAWRKADILIIDEISMMRADLLDKLDMCARLARGKNTPFGGVQILFCGDFYQLPPVAGKYPFDSKVWKALNLKTINLETPVRHNDDISYFHLLNRLRKGKQTELDLVTITSRLHALKTVDVDSMDIKPTKIYSTNKDVEKTNHDEFEKLEALVEGSYYAEDQLLERTVVAGRAQFAITFAMGLDQARTQVYTSLIRSCPDVIHLKVGAQYILTQNLDVKKGLVNGSRCVYVGEDRFRFKDGKEIRIPERHFTFRVGRGNMYFCRFQRPLKLGYAVTIHSSQGMTLDCALIDLGKSIFDKGQTYVALSRVRDLESVYLYDFDPKKIKVSPKVKDFYHSLGIQ